MLGDSLVESIQDRVRLLGVELQEEKYRLIQTFFWISAVVFTAMMTALLASATLVYCLWQTAPLAALVGLTLFYSISLTAAIFRLRYFVAHHSQPFAATLEELEEDRACIRKPS
jgi:uncharacterized membrane protein YqjE